MLKPTMQIQQLRIQNFRVFRDINILSIPSVAVFIGANGSGKSTLFEVFGFLKEFNDESQHKAIFSNQVGPDHGGCIGFDLAGSTHHL